MAGNVFEWVADWYMPDYYKNSPALNPAGPDIGLDFAKQGPVRVLRGGSWFAPETSLHTSHRFWNQPENNSYGIGLGFRCANSEGPRTASAASSGGVTMNPRMEARAAYMQALVDMGSEKHAQALTAIDKAISLDPKTREYKDVRELIKKNLDKKK
jgi:sulfatase modifying factor 1